MDCKVYASVKAMLETVTKKESPHCAPVPPPASQRPPLAAAHAKRLICLLLNSGRSWSLTATNGIAACIILRPPVQTYGSQFVAGVETMSTRTT